MKRLGHDVRILEQHPSSTRDGEAAGVSAGAQTQEFLDKYDLFTEPCVVPASGLQIVDSDFKPKSFTPWSFRLTTWKCLYYRLRANFDGCSSEYVPRAPRKLEKDGEASFEIGRRVTDVLCVQGTLTLKFEDVINGGGGSIHADGSRSTIRKLLLPRLKSSYAGYLTWRATVPEKYISESSQQAFHDRSTSYSMHKSYIIVYVYTNTLSIYNKG